VNTAALCDETSMCVSDHGLVINRQNAVESLRLTSLVWEQKTVVQKLCSGDYVYKLCFPPCKHTTQMANGT